MQAHILQTSMYDIANQLRLRILEDTPMHASTDTQRIHNTYPMHRSKQIQQDGVVYIGNTVHLIRDRITQIKDEEMLENVLIHLDILEFMANALYDHWSLETGQHE